MAAKPSPLKRFVDDIKNADKASRTISNFLKSLIEEHSASESFDRYIDRHAKDARQYLERFNERPRMGMFRASSAGKCLQQQAFKAIVASVNAIVIVDTPPQMTTVDEKLVFIGGEYNEVDVARSETSRKGRQYRALFNGTFAHVRWHMFFDYLDAQNIIKTIFKEELRYNEEFLVSGTCDRVIEFEFQKINYRAVVDFKTMKKEYFEKLVEPEEQHRDQQHVYDMMEYGADVWVMLYENKNDQDVKVYDKKYDPDTLMQLKSDYKKMRRWVEDVKAKRVPETLPIETSYCNFCEFNSLCKKINKNRQKTTT